MDLRNPQSGLCRPMNEVLRLEGTRDLLLDLIAREQRRSGSNQEIARDYIARKVGATPSTFRNLVKYRLKKTGNWLQSLVQYAISDLERELDDIHQRIEAARALGGPPDIASIRRLERIQARASSILSDFHRGRAP
jgi:hypothetical protein